MMWETFAQTQSSAWSLRGSDADNHFIDPPTDPLRGASGPAQPGDAFAGCSKPRIHALYDQFPLKLSDRREHVDLWSIAAGFALVVSMPCDGKTRATTPCA